MTTQILSTLSPYQIMLPEGGGREAGGSSSSERERTIDPPIKQRSTLYV